MNIHSSIADPKPANADYAVDIVNDARVFDGMREEWNALLAASGSWNPFQTWEWLSAWWRHLRGAAKLHVVVARAGGQLMAAIPLMVVRRGLSPARLEFLGARVGGADYLDVIARRGHESAAVQVIGRAIDATQLTTHLDHLPPSALVSRLHTRLEQTGWTALASSPDVCPFVELSGHSFESYLSSLGASHRANFRRRLRALGREFDLQFARVQSQEERRNALETLFAFHDQRWRGCGGSSAFHTAGLRAFHQDLTRRALECGWLRLYTLSLSGSTVGVLYGFAGADRFYFYQHGFSQAHAGYSVGLVLMGLSIRAAVEEGLSEFDLLYGHETYKKLWARRERPLGRVTLFPPGVSGRLLQRSAETRQAVRAVVQHLRLKGTHGAA